VNKTGASTATLRQLEIEPRREVLHVLPVQVVEALVLMPGDLELGRDAGHRNSEYVSDSLETLAWPTVGWAAEIVRLPAVALLVEAQGMAVDLPAGGVLEDEARRPFHIAATKLAEGRANALDIFEAHAEIEILVRARLLAQ
jgi:hypothetical protein